MELFEQYNLLPSTETICIKKLENVLTIEVELLAQLEANVYRLNHKKKLLDKFNIICVKGYYESV
jgi:hypothetical protein